jgi:hydroxyethylthiazole kinase
VLSRAERRFANPLNLIRIMPAEESEMAALPSSFLHILSTNACIERAFTTLEAVRHHKPRVHVITNSVAQAFTANMLLAIGAQPSMTIAAEEIASFTSRSNALVINLGTLDIGRKSAISEAISTARRLKTPWLLDPVLVDASPSRLLYARECLRFHPAILRCNAREFEALKQEENGEMLSSSVLALTGKDDMVSDKTRRLTLHNGHEWMSCVTAIGCAGTAVMAAFISQEPDAFIAAFSALMVLGVAGEMASEHTRGPGTFQPALLDALYHLDQPQLMKRAKLT